MSATSTPGSAPKSMSSRLLTMKFMQRAANSPPSPAAPSPTDEPSAKRRRVESASTPSKVNIDDLADKRAIQAALAGEEAKRQAALERQATEADDTRWVLSFEDQPHSATPPALALRVVQTGFAHLDASPSQARFTNDNSEDRPVEVGRRSFGRFNKVLEKQQNPLLEDDSESDEEDEEDVPSESESDSDDSTSALIKATRHEAAERARAERKTKKRAAKSEAEEVAKKRRKEQRVVNLNGLTSLSGKAERKPQIPAGLTCFNCGGPHFKKDCRANKRGFQGEDDGPARKVPRAR